MGPPDASAVTSGPYPQKLLLEMRVAYAVHTFVHLPGWKMPQPNVYVCDRER